MPQHGAAAEVLSGLTLVSVCGGCLKHTHFSSLSGRPEEAARWGLSRAPPAQGLLTGYSANSLSKDRTQRSVAGSYYFLLQAGPLKRDVRRDYRTGVPHSRRDPCALRTGGFQLARSP